MPVAVSKIQFERYGRKVDQNNLVDGRSCSHTLLGRRRRMRHAEVERVVIVFIDFAAGWIAQTVSMTKDVEISCITVGEVFRRCVVCCGVVKEVGERGAEPSSSNRYAVAAG